MDKILQRQLPRNKYRKPLRVFWRIGFIGVVLVFIGACATTPAADTDGDGKISNAEYQQESRKIEAIKRDIRKVERKYDL